LHETGTLGAEAARMGKRCPAFTRQLIERLHTVEDDEHIQEAVESAMAHENASLVEEKAALAKLLERERAEKVVKEKQLEQEKIEAEKVKARAEQVEQLLRQKEKELALLKKQAGQDSWQVRQQKEQAGQAL